MVDTIAFGDPSLAKWSFEAMKELKKLVGS